MAWHPRHSWSGQWPPLFTSLHILLLSPQRPPVDRLVLGCPGLFYSPVLFLLSLCLAHPHPPQRLPKQAFRYQHFCGTFPAAPMGLTFSSFRPTLYGGKPLGCPLSPHGPSSSAPLSCEAGSASVSPPIGLPQSVTCREPYEYLRKERKGLRGAPRLAQVGLICLLLPLQRSPLEALLEASFLYISHMYLSCRL